MSEDRSRQLPQHLVAPEFGEVNVRRGRDGAHVQVVMRPTMDGAKSEGWPPCPSSSTSWRRRSPSG